MADALRKRSDEGGLLSGEKDYVSARKHCLEKNRIATPVP